MAPVLGYWDLRGLGQPIRLLLEQAGADYKERLYVSGGPPDFDRSDYLKEKFNLALDFPNLPYYIDGDIKLTQSHVILRHLARKHNLNGKNEADVCRIDLLANQVYEYHIDNAALAYNPDYLIVKDDYLKDMQGKLKLISDFLGSNEFVAGNYVTYADFCLFEFLEVYMQMGQGLLKDFPVLERFHQRVNKLPAVEKYFNSSRGIKFPFYGSQAYLGGAYSDLLLNQ